MRLLPFLFSVLVLGCASQTSPHRNNSTLETSPSIEEISTFPPMTCAPDAERRSMVRARHIMVLALAKDARSGPKATPDELRAAYSKLANARLELINGASFEDVWHKYADPNPSFGRIGGDLGFFRKGVMVPEFEKASFCLPVGEVSPVIRTFFGFHLIQVTDIRH